MVISMTVLLTFVLGMVFFINDHTSKNYLGLPFADATCDVGQADSFFKIDNSYKNHCETLGNTKRCFKVFYRQLRYEQCFHMMQGFFLIEFSKWNISVRLIRPGYQG